MPWFEIIWIDGAGGNVEHLRENGVSADEAEEVLRNPMSYDISDSSDRPIAFGRTNAGRSLAVVFEKIDDITLYPATAFDIER